MFDGVGVGFFGGGGVFGGVAVDDDAGDFGAGGAEGPYRQEGVVDGAEVGAGDDDGGELEPVGEVEDGGLAVEGDGDATDAFDDHDVGADGHLLDGAVDGGEVDGDAFALGGDGGGEGLDVADGADLVEGVAGVGGGREELGVFGDEAFAAMDAAGGDGFADGDLRAAAGEPLADGAGDEGFADAGVGAGDEEAGDGDGGEQMELLFEALRFYTFFYV